MVAAVRHPRWSEGPGSPPASVEETAQLLLRVTVSRLSLRDWIRIAYGIRPPDHGGGSLADAAPAAGSGAEAPDRAGGPKPFRADGGWGSSFAAIRVAEAWSGLPASHPEADNYLLNSSHFSQGRVARVRARSSGPSNGESDNPRWACRPTTAAGFYPKVFAERLLARGLLPEEELAIRYESKQT